MADRKKASGPRPPPPPACCGPTSSPGTRTSSAHEVAPDLAPWVENHWSLRWELPAGATYVSSTLPHPACHLGVERGHLRHGIGDDPVVVTGVPTRRWDVEIRDAGWVQSVKFRPGGLTSLTGHPARDLRDTTVPASTVFPAATTDALRRLGPEVPAEECRAVVEQALRSLRTEPEPDYRTVLEVVAADARRPHAGARRPGRGALRDRHPHAAAAVREVRRRQPQVGALPLPDARRGHRPRRGVRRIAGRPRRGVRLVRPGPLHPRVHRADRGAAERLRGRRRRPRALSREQPQPRR